MIEHIDWIVWMIRIEFVQLFFGLLSYKLAPAALAPGGCLAVDGCPTQCRPIQISSYSSRTVEGYYLGWSYFAALSPHCSSKIAARWKHRSRAMTVYRSMILWLFVVKTIVGTLKHKFSKLCWRYHVIGSLRFPHFTTRCSVIVRDFRLSWPLDMNINKIQDKTKTDQCKI